MMINGDNAGRHNDGHYAEDDNDAAYGAHNDDEYDGDDDINDGDDGKSRRA